MCALGHWRTFRTAMVPRNLEFGMRTNRHFAILFACLVVSSAAWAQDFKSPFSVRVRHCPFPTGSTQRHLWRPAKRSCYSTSVGALRSGSIRSECPLAQ